MTISHRSALADSAMLAGRALMSVIFIYAGAGKIGAYAATQAYMESAGVPGVMLPLVIALELGGGLALLAGYRARVVAFLLAGFTLLTAVLFHRDFSDYTQMLFFMKNLAIAGGLLMVSAVGAGRFALSREQ